MAKTSKARAPGDDGSQDNSLSLSTVQQPLKKGTTINNDLSVVPLRRRIAILTVCAESRTSNDDASTSAEHKLSRLASRGQYDTDGQRGRDEY